MFVFARDGIHEPHQDWRALQRLPGDGTASADRGWDVDATGGRASNELNTIGQPGEHEAPHFVEDLSHLRICD